MATDIRPSRGVTKGGHSKMAIEEQASKQHEILLCSVCTVPRVSKYLS